MWWTHITFIDHTDITDTKRHLNETKINLNKLRKIQFAENACDFLLQLQWYCLNNSGNTSLGNENGFNCFQST